MGARFDLLAKPWIPAVQGGKVVELNLRDVLYQAHEIEEIWDPLPIVEFGLYRFLTALVMDIYEPGGLQDLEEILDSGKIDAAKVDAYFDKWGCCFDLFDEERPFLQTPGMDSEPGKPLCGLLPAVPSGTAVNHFHHKRENEFGVSPAAAARLLTTMAPFMTAGGAGLSPSINGAPPWYVLINGKSLFHTIFLNCPVLPLKMDGNAPPAWRNPNPPVSDKRCTSASLAEALTWRPRRVCLIPGEPGVCALTGKESPVVVRSMKFKAGASCDFTWQDPSVPYKLSSNGGAVVLRPQEDREIWRDTGPFVLLHHAAYRGEQEDVRFERPALVSQFAQLTGGRYIPRDTELSVTVYGMRTDLKMKVFEWQREQLKAPSKLVMNATFALTAQDAMDKASNVEYALKKAIKHIYRDDGKGNTKAFDSLIANAVRNYWSSLRQHYDAMLWKMAEAENPEEAKWGIQAEWQEDVRRTALDVFDRFAGDLDTDGDQMRRLVEAQSRLYWSIRKVFETPEEKDARKQGRRVKAEAGKGGG